MGRPELRSKITLSCRMSGSVRVVTLSEMQLEV